MKRRGKELMGARESRGRGCWPWRMPGYVPVVTTILLVLAMSQVVRAETFHCRAGDVACLIDAIQTANANGGANTITLDAGTYTLTAINNRTDGANGLPSITSPLTIRGVGVGTTILERARQAPVFRLIHVAAAGTLTLEGLTLQGDTEAPSGDGLLHIGGQVILAHSSLVNTRTRVSEDLPQPSAMPLHRPRISGTDLRVPPRRPPSPQPLEDYVALVQRTLKREAAVIPQAGLVEVTLAIRQDGSVMHTEVVQLDGPATLRSQLLPIVNRLGPWPPPPVEAEVLVVTVVLLSQYPGADLLDRFGSRP